MAADRKHPSQIAACFRDVPDADRPAFGAIGIEQARAAPAVDRGGKLPRQVDRIADAGVHAEAAGWRHHMRGVAGDEAAPAAIALGDQLAPHPRQHAQNLEFEVAADGAADRRFDFFRRVVVRLGSADQRQAPLVAAVDGDDGGPGAFRTDENVTIGLALVMQGKQMRATENDVGGVGQDRIARHADAERFAHQAARAVAADDVARRDFLARAGFGILHERRHQIGILRKRDKPPAVAQRYALLRRRERAQDRIEHVLRAALAPLRAVLGRRRLADAGEALAAQFITGETGQIDVVLRVVARIGRALDRRHQAPAPAEFHGADADEVHAWLIDRAVGLLDQHAANAAPAQIAGERQPDRSTADDQYRLD